MVGILYFVTKEESMKQSEEPESNKAENDKGKSDLCTCIVSSIVSDCKERAAALRVTSVMARYWSTQLQSHAEASADYFSGSLAELEVSSFETDAAHPRAS